MIQRLTPRDLVASIEGPPETPYEGGIFWILVLASQKTPGGAPILRFHTKIYHPNIDPRTGVLCADFEHKWSPAKVPPSLKNHFAESTAAWSKIRQTSPEMWSLLSLLIAICGLLASPNVHDPLVPEIAQKYVEDRDDFDEIAKKWTAEHAKASGRPDESSLRFPDEPSGALETETSTEPTPNHKDPENDLEYSSSAMQEYLRSKYDEKFDHDWMPRSDSSRHSSVFTRASGSVTTTAFSELGTSESESQVSRIEAVVDSLLLLDAKQSHLRQLTGECFSKIEQWRMVREVRLALEKQLYRSSPYTSSKGNPTSEFWAETQIRTLIRESATRLFDPTAPERLRQYLYTLMTTFSKIRSFKSTPAGNDGYSHPIAVTPGADPSNDSTAESSQATIKTPSLSEGAVSSVLLVPTTMKFSDPIPVTPGEESNSISQAELDQAKDTAFLLDDSAVFLRFGTTADSGGSISEEHPPRRFAVTDDTPELTNTTSTLDSTTSKSRDDHLDVNRTSPYSPYTPSGGAFDIFSRKPTPRDSPYGSHGFYSQRSGPSARYHSRQSSRGIMQDSARAFSPRYTSTGYYSTAANVNRKQSSSSAPRSENRRRNSYTYSAYQGDSEEEQEYVDYLVDGAIYRVPAHWPKYSTYNYRGHGSDYNNYSPSPYSPPPRRRRQSSSTPERRTTARPAASPKKPAPAPKATEADARRHRIPSGYSLKNWDPSEEPIMLLGSVFDANSLGKWIYDWTVYHHGPATPITDMAGELWLLLIQLAGKIKRAEECMPRIRKEENREMVDDFIESGERLTEKLKKLLKACETPMLKVAKKTPGEQPGKNAGTEFVDSIFGRDRHLESTEKFMASIRLWNLRFDANCEDILRRPGQFDSEKSTLPKLITTPVAIRTAFGLEDIVELEPTTDSFADTASPATDAENPSFRKSTEVETEGCKSNGSLKADKSIDQSHVSQSPKQVTSPDEPAPSASVTSPEDDWFPILTAKKGKKKKSKKTAEKIPDAEEKSPGQQPAQNDECDSSVPQKAKKDQISDVEELAKEHDPAQKTELDDWVVWDFSTKRDRLEKKGKFSDMGATSKEKDSPTKPEQNEGLDDFSWGSFTTKKDKKMKKNKSKEIDADVTLKESELVPILMSDPMLKHENDDGWDWSANWPA